MPTVIRFARHGSKKKPFFRIVVQDKTAPRDGRFIENLGTFNPIVGKASLQVHKSRLEYWLSTGAQMSDSVKNRVTNYLSSAVESPSPSTQTPKPDKQDKPLKKNGDGRKP